MHDALADRTGVVYDPYTPEQVADLKKQLELFLTCGPNEEEENLEFKSVRQMREVCKLFKVCSNNRQSTPNGSSPRLARAWRAALVRLPPLRRWPFHSGVMAPLP